MENKRKLVKLENLIEEISMGPFGSDIKVENFVSYGFPVLNGSNLAGIKLSENDFKYITEEKAKTFKKAIANRGDIVITHRGTLGQICYIPENSKYEKYLISQSQFRVAFDKNLICSKYLVYYFHTVEGQKRLLANKSYVGVPALAQATTNFKLIEFPLLNLDTQRRIATVLSTLDAKIELHQKLNAELEAMAKTLYDYWFVQFDFPDAEGKPYKSSGGSMTFSKELNRKVPTGWEVGVLGDYSKVISGFAFNSSWWKEEGIPVVKILNIKEDYTVDLNGCSFVDDDKIGVAKKFVAKNGNVIIAMTGATIGKFGIIPKHHKTILVNQRVGLFDIGESPVKKLPFLINTLKLSYIREQIFYVSSGCAQPNISAEQINNLKILIPNEILINEFNEKFENFYSLLLQNLQETQQLQQLRDWLLPMLMNGQVAVG